MVENLDFSTLNKISFEILELGNGIGVDFFLLQAVTNLISEK